MLLSSLSILMGAILVPLDYVELYITHIILMCLYLIASKRWIVLCFVFLSLVSVIDSEYFITKELPIEEGDALFIDFENKVVFLTFDESSLPKRRLRQNSVSLKLVSSAALSGRYDDFSLARTCDVSSCASPKRMAYKVSRVLLANQYGSWKQKRLYIDRQLAEIEVKPLITHSILSTVHSSPKKSLDTIAISGTEIEIKTTNETTMRGRWLHLLDDAFDQKASWRFSKALLFGNADLWSEKETWVIRTLGLAHLFVVSGLHTGFMFVIGVFVSKKIWFLFPRNILLSSFTRWHLDMMIITPLLVGYAYLTDWGEPVVRATIMLCLYLCARMMQLKVSALSIVTFTLWLVLLFEPRILLNPGLWLSFSMVYLLIGFYKVKHKYGRLFYLQVMLSTASMVLILGWQEAISSASVLMNLLLIPFAAFIWFPWGWLSSLEVALLGTSYSYHLLDWLLVYVIYLMEWVVFTVPLLHFELFSSAIPRWFMLILVVYWVFQSPLKRGWFAFLVVIATLFLSNRLYWVETDFIVENRLGNLTLVNREGVLLSNNWHFDSLKVLDIASLIRPESVLVVVLSPKKAKGLSSKTLLEGEVDWVILNGEAGETLKNRLEALQVNWVVIRENESLNVFFDGEGLKLRHSACLHSFFLFKVSTCKHVEKLENMLNYRQN
ncbi:ComEC/Rec2 family competence protein [Marinomonas sp.]|nr:ComEC/Rec2 family competence protein [Marinomonas sp.]MDB4836906.1 ComEC/Rec2 family competence protein [Marinomonas sp.]